MLTDISHEGQDGDHPINCQVASMMTIEEFAVFFKQYESASHSQCLWVSASTNYKIVIKTINTILDLLVFISCMKSPCIWVCFFLMKSLVAALPNICMVFLLLIHKQNTYHFSTVISIAWKRFKRDLSLFNSLQFLQLFKEEEVQMKDHIPELLLKEFMGPVTTGGHIWHNISHIQFYIWSRQDDGKLELNPESIKQTQWSAYRVCSSLFFQFCLTVLLSRNSWPWMMVQIWTT